MLEHRTEPLAGCMDTSFRISECAGRMFCGGGVRNAYSAERAVTGLPWELMLTSLVTLAPVVKDVSAHVISHSTLGRGLR